MVVVAGVAVGSAGVAVWGCPEWCVVEAGYWCPLLSVVRRVDPWVVCGVTSALVVWVSGASGVRRNVFW